MVETWRDSWFEEGMRLFYMCRAKVDDVLPIEIRPARELTRVFVGRVELCPPRCGTRSDGPDRRRYSALQRFGRFPTPLSPS